jgi:hypothetical protein
VKLAAVDIDYHLITRKLNWCLRAEQLNRFCADETAKG